MIYYSLNDILRAYNISKSTLKRKIITGEIRGERHHHCLSETVFMYVIPESELSKLDYCKKSDPIASEQAQPEYREKREQESKENRVQEALRRAESAQYYHGITRDYEEYLHSEEWRKLRRERIALDGYRCQNCGCVKNLEAHHINYSRLGHEGEIDDLVTLCHNCHVKLHKEKHNLELSIFD